MRAVSKSSEPIWLQQNSLTLTTPKGRGLPPSPGGGRTGDEGMRRQLNKCKISYVTLLILDFGFAAPHPVNGYWASALAGAKTGATGEADGHVPHLATHERHGSRSINISVQVSNRCPFHSRIVQLLTEVRSTCLPLPPQTALADRDTAWR